MTKDEEITMINEKLDFYVMEASDEEFDTEEVRKLVKRLDELDPIPLPWKSDEEALKDFWDYCEERQREERIIADMKISAKKLDKYFPPQYSTKERENIIIQLLEQWSADQVQSE